MNLQAKLTLWYVMLSVVIVGSISGVDFGNNMQQQFESTLDRADLIKATAGKFVSKTLNAQRTKPLPEVLKETVMDPIGASNTWRWFGYESSWVVLDGKLVQSVSGGGHWGGGAYMSAYDMARFGYLTLRRGKWKDRQVLSERWVESALEPTAVEPGYGFMNWFLNTDRKLYPSAPAKAFAHIGNGTNLVYVDPEHDIVAVVRWIDSRSIDGFLKRLLASLPP